MKNHNGVRNSGMALVLLSSLALGACGKGSTDTASAAGAVTKPAPNLAPNTPAPNTVNNTTAFRLKLQQYYQSAQLQCALWTKEGRFVVLGSTPTNGQTVDLFNTPDSQLIGKTFQLNGISSPGNEALVNLTITKAGFTEGTLEPFVDVNFTATIKTKVGPEATNIQTTSLQGTKTVKVFRSVEVLNKVSAIFDREASVEWGPFNLEAELNSSLYTYSTCALRAVLR